MERKALAAVKAKEKELKDEKESERKVGGDYICEGFPLTVHSDGSMQSRRSALPRKSANDLRRWRRRCTRGVSSA